MFCVKCGKEIPDSSVYCPYCGDKVEKRTVLQSVFGKLGCVLATDISSKAWDAVIEEKNENGDAVETNRMRKSFNKKLLGIPLAVLLIVGIYYSFIYGEWVITKETLSNVVENGENSRDIYAIRRFDYNGKLLNVEATHKGIEDISVLQPVLNEIFYFSKSYIYNKKGQLKEVLLNGGGITGDSIIEESTAYEYDGKGILTGFSIAGSGINYDGDDFSYKVVATKNTLDAEYGEISFNIEAEEQCCVNYTLEDPLTCMLRIDEEGMIAQEEWIRPGKFLSKYFDKRGVIIECKYKDMFASGFYEFSYDEQGVRKSYSQEGSSIAEDNVIYVVDEIDKNGNIIRLKLENQGDDNKWKCEYEWTKVHWWMRLLPFLNRNEAKGNEDVFADEESSSSETPVAETQNDDSVPAQEEQLSDDIEVQKESEITSEDAELEGDDAFKVGHTYKTTDVLRIREGPGTEFRHISRHEVDPDETDITEDHDKALIKKGSEVVCIEVSGDWIRIKSGWICGYMDGNRFLE